MQIVDNIRYTLKTLVTGVEQKDFTNILPKEIVYEIFSYLNEGDLVHCLLVNKKWKVLASAQVLWEALLFKKAFGGKKWNTYFGESVTECPLPPNMLRILKEPCPFWTDQKVEKSHFLFLVPAENEKPIDLLALQERVKASRTGPSTQYNRLEKEVIDQYGKRTNKKPYWALMTINIIPNSVNQYYSKQKELIDQASARTGANYDIPSLWEVVACIFAKYVSSKELLFKNDYTLCKETIFNKFVTVGHFSSKGLNIESISTNAFSNVCGVAVIRRLTPQN